MKHLSLFIIFFITVTTLKSQNKISTENVFLITFDGLRWQEVYSGADSTLLASKEFTSEKEEVIKRFWDPDPLVRREKLLPFFWNTIAKNGQLYGNRNYDNKVNLTNEHWFSYPGYNEILTGFGDPEINSNDKVNNKNITILEFANQQNAYKGKVAAFGSWDVFPYIINEERSKIPVNAGFKAATGGKITEKEQFLNELQPQIPTPWSSVRFDAFTHHYALEHIKKHQPKLVFIAYGETDDFAHDGSYDHYLKSANQTDAFINELWGYVQSHPQYKNKTTFIIATDHGRGTVPLDAWKSHGKEIVGSDQVWFAVIGPDTSAKGEIKSSEQLYQNQIASTIAQLLKLNFKPKTEGVKPVSGMIIK